jgi:glycerate kinase
MNVLIAPDKFKGSLDAAGVARAIARGWRAVRPNDRLRLLPMSDGGDGFGTVTSIALGARARWTRTVNAAGQPCRACWWYAPRTQTAIIEAARIIGLAMLPAGRRRPFDLDTFGVGEVLHRAARAGTRRCLIGIGGSATNDGGFGLARALGWRFFNRSGTELTRWTDLAELVRAVPPACRFLPELEVAVDVQNLLLGPQGATRIYGPQKGLRPADFPKAEHALRRLAKVMAQVIGQPVQEIPGSGAAGGLGYGLAAFAGARLVRGFEVFREFSGLDAHLGWADVVVSGEGRFDASSAMGKGVGCLLDLARRHRKKCLVFAGAVESPSARRGAICRGLTEIAPADDAIRAPARWLEVLVRQTLTGLKPL